MYFNIFVLSEITLGSQMEKYQKIKKIMLANETYTKLWELNAQYLQIFTKIATIFEIRKTLFFY